MDLSVVIPAHNRSRVLEVCLRCLSRQTLPPDRYEVIVVDDGSEEDLRPVVDSFRGGLQVRLLRQPRNLGRAAARNRGIAAARGEVVVFVDSDVFVVPEFLAAHAEIHAHRLRAVGRGPLLLTEHLEDPLRNPPYLRDPSPAFLDTANASVRREDLLEAGGFDEDFREYGWEDFELGTRLARLGLRRVYRRRALAYHYQPLPDPQSLEHLFRKEEERARMAVRLLRKRPGWRTRWAVQHTPLHRALAFLMTQGGHVDGDRLRQLLQLSHLSPARKYLLLRGVLNRHYLQTLSREWTAAWNRSASAW
ncbi:MAG: glycosyltransferase [Armatimonadota bacterium]|nr:glycosyltransferase [Armatimonadota bacterium]MDR7443285.1 glycosyltransferase [Armatimonadota bacterium]MDR7569952.1 glycosyltransferase [Armatimonadota bacterium]MDR7614385.1 glycosyltransferase [Armatimonadota bacterium]